MIAIIVKFNFFHFQIHFSYAPAPSNVRIWLSDLSCTSSDTALERCHHSGVGNNDCDHSEDVAISCFRGMLLTFNKQNILGLNADYAR